MSSQTTHTTTLKLKTDDREAKKLAQTIHKAFDPKHAKEMKVATRDLERQLGAAAKRQAELVKQLEGVKKGTDAYKKLNTELKQVKEHSELAAKALSHIDQAQQRMARRQEAGRGRNFVAGFGQGSGLAQYIPTGPGMGSRMLGAGIGGGLRRGWGSATAPFMMPGIGGLATGLSGIPIFGGFMAGQAQTAAAAYQSAVGYHRARHANLYFANNRIGSAVMGKGRAGAGLIAARDQAAMGLRNAILGPDNGDAKRSREDFEKLNPEPSYSDREGAARVFRHQMALRAGKAFEETGRDKAYRKWLEDREATAAMQRRGRIEGARKKFIAASNAVTEAQKSRRLGTRSGLGGEGAAVKLGFGPMQAQQMRGQFYQAAGGLFDQGEFNESMAAQVRYGVGAGASGAFARMGRAGGGGGGMIGLAQVLQGAFVQGLRGSQIPEYLQTLVGLGQTSEKQGIKLNVAEFQKLTMSLHAAGLQGLQGQRIGGGLVTAAQGLANRGVQSPLDVLMMRAAGFQPGQGLEGYAAAQARLESPDNDLIKNVLGAVTSGTAGFGSKGRALLTKRALGRLGVQVGMGQASKLIQAYGEGGSPDIEGLLSETLGMGGARGMYGEARRRVKAGAGLSVTAAGLEQQRIGVGAGAGWVAKFESNSLRAAGVMNNFSSNLNNLSKLVQGFIGLINNFTKGGIEGTADNFFRAIGLPQSKLPSGS